MNKIKIIKKNDEYSSEYQIGDTFKIEGTWYGGVHIIGKTGAPVSLDKDEYIYLDANPENKAASASVITPPRNRLPQHKPVRLSQKHSLLLRFLPTPEKMTQNLSVKSMSEILCAISKENGYQKRAPNISTRYWLLLNIPKQTKSWSSTRPCMHHSKSVQDHMICL